MYIFLIIVHVIVCFVLVLVVLLQAGRGGGVSDMMGGGQPQTLFGTQTNQFMTRATEVCAVVFILTSLTLGILSTQRGKSLVERRGLANMPVKTQTAQVPAAPTPAAPAATTSSEAPAATAAAPSQPAPADAR